MLGPVRVLCTLHVLLSTYSLTYLRAAYLAADSFCAAAAFSAAAACVLTALATAWLGLGLGLGLGFGLGLAWWIGLGLDGLGHRLCDGCGG